MSTCGDRYDASIFSSLPMAPSMAHPQWMPTPAKFRRQFTGRTRGASATSTTEVDVVVGHAVGDAGVDAPALQLWRCQQLDDAMDERDDGLIRNMVVLECANLHGGGRAMRQQGCRGGDVERHTVCGRAILSTSSSSFQTMRNASPMFLFAAPPNR